jgi:hypothetical protein
MQVFPDLWEKYEDPVVRIEFGPIEDRFHMQLAIDSASNYHVSLDQGVLREADNMAQFGVTEVTPREYVCGVADRLGHPLGDAAGGRPLRKATRHRNGSTSLADR